MVFGVQAQTFSKDSFPVFPSNCALPWQTGPWLYLKEGGLPELTSSKAMRLPTVSGGERVVQFVNLWRWVHAKRGGGKFYHFLKQCFDSSASNLPAMKKFLQAGKE